MKIVRICQAATLGTLLSLCAMPLFAQTTTLTFEGLGNGEPISQFYNGGTGGSGSGPGTNYGISFSPSALALIDSDAPGGGGNFGGEPSPDTIMYFSGSPAIMNVSAGFAASLSFYYSSPNLPGTVIIYDGTNATGNVLATINLPTTPSNGAPDPTGTFSPFILSTTSFNGVARSVSFGGGSGNIGYDNITVGVAKTCASEGYTYTKLSWCQNICEKGYTGATLAMWIHRWTNRYRDLPYCAVEGTGPQPM